MKKNILFVINLVLFVVTLVCMLFLFDKNISNVFAMESIEVNTEEGLTGNNENIVYNTVSENDRSNKEGVILGNERTLDFQDLTDVKYIDNAHYFLLNPLHGDNNKYDNIAGTCTTVATQMLMGYHNYFSDRRIIPDEANGKKFLDGNYGDIAYHPAFERNFVSSLGCKYIGTSDGFYQELFDLTPISEWPAIGQAAPFVVNGAKKFIEKYTPESARDNISISWNLFSKSIAQSEIDAGRPIILIYQPIMTGADSFHVVVAYGYGKLDGVDGFLVHYGWGDKRIQVWVPASWFGFQITMEVNHVHKFENEKIYKDAYVSKNCSICGLDTVDTLYDFSNGTINGLKYPLMGSINIPTTLNIYSTNTASFSIDTVNKIGANAFNYCTGINQISIPSSIVTIENKAFTHSDISIITFESGSRLQTIGESGYNSYLIHDYTGNRYDTGDLYYVGGPTTFTVNWTEKPLAECYNQYQFYYAVYGPNQLKELRTSNLSNRKVHIMNDIDVSNEDWISIPEIDFELNGKGYTITFKNESVSTNENFGFANLCSGWIYDLNFKAKIRTNEADSTSTKQYIGVIAAELRGGVIENCKLLSYNEGTNFYYYSSTSTNVDVLILNPKAITGGLTGLHYGNGLQYSENIGCAIASYVTLGGISGESHKYIGYCKNRAPPFYELKEGDGRRAVGGISGYHESNHNLSDCENYGNITFVSVISGNTGNSPAMAQIVGYDYMKYNESCIIDYTCSGNVIVNSTIGNDYKTYVKNTAIGYSSNQEELPVGGGCVASGTLITLADGRQVPVEELKGDELLLVWNLQTGTFDIAPILFIDSEIADVYNVIVLKFSDGTQVKVIYEHAFWDIDLNRYVFLRDDATNYIGHWFNKQEMNEEGNLNWKKVQLIEVVFQQEYTIAWSPVTYSHLCYYVNGMLSMPGNTEGFVNIFEVDADTMKVNEELYLEDIEQYGLYTYEEFTQIIQIPESVFDAFNGQYLKVAIGKGYLDVERLRALVNRYSIFFN